MTMRATVFLAVALLPAAPGSVDSAQQPKQAKLSGEEAKRVAALIDQLDSKKFPEREWAMKQLGAFGERVLPTLEKVAKGPLALEVRQRLNQVIRRLRAPEQERIAVLVQHLGARSYRDREAAMRELETFGPAALKPLRAAALGPDQEVVRRAKALIARILKQRK
jgi:hypothetical protein